ncbi:hypothetical protein C0Q70_08851 [Pomacea canaliculata]|uniref:Deoxynucleoside kinase domain-containing protein n=1 Tax=Pomacea canaliculata TaxID=400727 RepID=A0A2T7P874_POMCA|nr:hypothetical protein C0Q70_08851 [Pomacea canaliculata]
MALIITRAVSALQPHARQLLLVQAGRVQASVLPSTTQVAHLTSTHGEPSKSRHPPWPYKKRPYNSFYQYFDNTRKRFDDNTKVIVIDGNLAVGKSWFGEKLAKEFDMKFFPDPRDSNMFLTGENFDLRSLNEQLPPRIRFTDLETFYQQKAPKEQLESIGRTLLTMYYSSFFEYVDALEHLLNTGQGVVVERGIFSHMVFQNVFRKMGFITAPALKYMNFVYDNTICELWRPHLVIYLDAPFPFLRKLVNKRNVVSDLTVLFHLFAILKADG